MDSPTSEIRPRASRGLRHDALGFLDAIVMAIAGGAPAYTMAATTAALLLAVGLGAPGELIWCGIPMLGIAIAYRYLNQLSPNAGAAYSWVGKVLHPVLGFFSGWALACSALLFMVAGSMPAGAATLSLFSIHAANQTAWVTAVGAAWFVLMAVLAARGVRIAAKAQWLMTGIEVMLLVVFAVLGLIRTHDHPHRSFSFAWLDFSHISGFGMFVSGALIAAFVYWGWDVAANLSEETRNSERASGVGGVAGVVVLFALFELFTIVVTMDVPTRIVRAHSGDLIAYFGELVWPGTGGKLLVVAIILSTVSTLQATLSQATRSLYSMAREQTMPARFGRIHQRRQTPMVATIIVAAIVLSLFVASNFIGSVGAVLDDAISAIGLQICVYYGLAGLATVVGFRRYLLESVGNALFMGVLPLLGALFMFWIFIEAIPNQSVLVTALGLGGLAVGLIPLAYYWRRSDYLHTRPTLGRQLFGIEDFEMEREPIEV